VTETCACCGKPTDNAETHHVDHRHGNDHPDNRSPRDRRCHMDHHRNSEAAKFPYSPGP
jgi:hypothetical protein